MHIRWWIEFNMKSFSNSIWRAGLKIKLKITFFEYPFINHWYWLFKCTIKIATRSAKRSKTKRSQANQDKSICLFLHSFLKCLMCFSHRIVCIDRLFHWNFIVFLRLSQKYLSALFNWCFSFKCLVDGNKMFAPNHKCIAHFLFVHHKRFIAWSIWWKMKIEIAY